MKVRKRSGQLANLDISNIRKQTKPACEGLNASYETLELNAHISFVDEMPTSDIQKILIQTALNLTDIDQPDWTYVAARLTLYDMYHVQKRRYKKAGKDDIYKLITLKDYLEQNKHLLSYASLIDKFDINKLEAAIDGSRDELFTYLGIDTLTKRYLLKSGAETVELPQHMWMSLAMFVAQNEANPTKSAIEFYDVMSKLEFLLATPSLSNGRTLEGNCFSCAVGSMPDDLEGIFDSFKEVALGSKFGSGWGYDITRIRALGGPIRGIPEASNGVVPPMKIMNDVSVYVDQLGTRLGAIAVYLETWHKDILDFLDLKKNSGEDKRRAKELFIGVSNSDEFMRRVEANEMWTLFDPYDVPMLTETYGAEFEKHYLAAEKAAKQTPEKFANMPVEINAKDLWKRIQRYYWETGMPQMFFKDNANNGHHCPENGIIRSTNLCTEVFLPTDHDKVALCNLGSLNLARVTTIEDLERVIPIAMRMLDNVIDITTYPIPNSEAWQKYTRAVGLGIAGEAELIANKQIMYGSEVHRQWIDEFYGAIERISDNASMELAMERGPWREGVKYRNAYRRALAPTSSVSILMGTSAGHEPVFDKVWIEENKMGNFKVTAPNINTHNVAFYINAYDVDQEDAVRCTALRQKHFDQGISHNIYFRPGTTGKKVFDTIMLAWKLGMKSTYYLRSEGIKDNELATNDNQVACVGCAS